MTARILPFPSRRPAHDREVGEIVKVVGLRDSLAVELDHKYWARDHLSAFPAKPGHAGGAEVRPGLSISQPALSLPQLQLCRRSLHSKRRNSTRYKLTIPCNEIRSCAVTATVLSFSRMEDMPNRILELRRAARLSQEELGFRIGVSKMQISGMERGKRELSLTVMRRLADALGVYPADLLARGDNPGALADEERALLVRFRSAGPDQQANIARVAEALAPFGHRDRSAA